jgi:hypothetical protein
MSVPTTTSTIQVDESQDFNLVLLRHSNSEILLSNRHGGFVLPQITIPKRQRIARCINKGVMHKWNLRTICLFQPELQHSKPPNSDQYMVLEPRDPEWQPPSELLWIPRDRIRTVMDSPCEADVVKEILQRSDAHNNGILPGPFARSGWVDELLRWAKEHVHYGDLRLTGEFCQFNCDPFFSLIRLGSTGRAVWFKAVGEPNFNEYSITLGLARDHARFLPEIIAAKPEWNGWLMLEVEGEYFDQPMYLQRCEHIVETLAHLQLECIGESQRLSEIGCKDRRVATVVQQIDPFLETMGMLMKEQPSEPPVRLSQFELRELGEQLKDACLQMQLAGIPESLFHGDFNLGNIRINSTACVFIDWAEGCIGPPFLTLEYLVAHLHRANGGFVKHQDLRRAYARCWTVIMSEAQIANAMAVAPALAVLWYGVGSVLWRDPKLLRVGRVAGYFRSLTRRMHRELQQLRVCTGCGLQPLAER